jgi:UDP-N-acetylglucosamine 2-epimerase (non-hydrolysing)
MLYLLINARLVLTDSGGIQEEACVTETPCVTFRISTERPETIWVGANIISGTKPAKILNCVDTMLERGRKWENPLGNGKTGEKITDILLKKLL